MSYGAADQAMIDIDEFERRLRGPAPRPAGDPLAHLARLVTPASAKPEALDQIFAHPPKASPAPAEPFAAGRELADEFGAEGLRGPVIDDEHFAREFGAHPLSGNDRAYHEAAAPASEENWAPDAGYEQMVPPTAAPRSRRPLYAAAAVIAVGFLGVGSTFAFKANRAGNGELVEVKALPGPTKIQGADAGRTTSDATVLDRGAGATPVTKIVDRQERPVDLKDAVAKAPRVVPMTQQPSATTSSQMASLAAGNDGNPASLAEPRKVKTVSVRPDGSIVGNATMAAPADAAPSAATAQPNAPKSATPKMAARVATTPKPPIDKPEAAARPAPARPEAAKPVTPKTVAARPTRVARAADADDAAADTDATPVATTTRSSGGGGFAVQLAAPGSEAEAKSTASRLGQKFSDALGGARVSVQKASDKDVYRVRTAAMSREQAVAACEKVKAAGGSCFVAKN